MYLVGFYSPEERSGVTQLSLSIFHWLRDHSSFSTAFVSNGKLESEPITSKLIHCFSDLTTTEQKLKLSKLRKKFDIIIYDASGVSLEEAQKLLPIVDRLFIIGEAFGEYAQTLFNIIAFHKAFDPQSRDLVNQIHNDAAFVLQSDFNKVGFATSNNAEEISKIISKDFSMYRLHQMYIKKQQEIITKIKKMNINKLRISLVGVGMQFEKAILFEKYIQLRLACGQNFPAAAENLFPTFLEHNYDELLRKFQSELSIAQISFDGNMKGKGE